MGESYYIKLHPVFKNDLRSKLLILQSGTEIINNELFILATSKSNYWENGDVGTVRSFETFLKLKTRFSESKWFPRLPNEVYLGAIHLFNRNVKLYLEKKRTGKLDSYPSKNGKATGRWFNRLNCPVRRTVLFELNLKRNGAFPDYRVVVLPEQSEIKIKLPVLGEVVLKNHRGVDLSIVMDKPLRSIRFVEKQNDRSMETNWYCELLFVDEVTDWLFLKTQ